MAGALVAGAALSALFNVLLDRLASREVVDFFRGGQLSRRQLLKFQTIMNTVSGVLDDAEEKQITSSRVKKWLDDLKDVAYEADDFLDEISYKLEVQEVPKSYSKQVRNLLITSVNPRRKGMGNHMKARLKEILERLELLLQQKDPLGLERASSSLVSSFQRRPQTTSLVDDSGIYGRTEDKESIISSLLSDSANSRQLGVVPIVGMGGVGKTTLAQLVYNDSRVKQWFDKVRAWVCVSEDFDVGKLTKNILKEIGLYDCDSLNLNQLHDKLEEKVRGQKVLLVLDDVWNENYADWESLLVPLKSVAQGSKVVVTTRNDRVALVMSRIASPIHKLKELNEDDCWSLFAKYAFDDCNSCSYPGLVDVGRRICRKCKGLPLAAKTLGSLLHCKRDSKEWEKILQSNMWDLRNDNIIPALRLSYHHLPPHLKQCFAYCAVFPKDFKFIKEDLVLLWMAEGFILQTNKNSDMEDLGAEYFEDLASMSFFQKFGRSEDRDWFVMHHLIHDLARFTSGEFCFNGEDGEDVNADRPTERTRHAYLTSNQFGEDVSLALFMRGKLEVLRSLICSVPYGQWHLENKISRLPQLRVVDVVLGCYEDDVSNLVASSKHLRLMRLRGGSLKRLPKNVTTLRKLQTMVVEDCGELTTLPESIGNLKHLRHLSLARASMRLLPDSVGKLKDLRYLDLRGSEIERLPESICGMYYLQTLILRWCIQLVELPDKMMDLINLCHLDVKGTGLKYMPVHMGKLTKLQTLPIFVVGKQGGSRLGELGELRNLKGTLELLKLENVVDEQDALGANLKETKGLERLYFCWEGNDAFSDDGTLDRSVLQHLQPHVNVGLIEIRGYRGTSFPDWFGDSSYSNIVRLELWGCGYCTSLPPLGQLPSLEYLWVEGFHSVVSLGPEFYGSCKSTTLPPFKSLKTMHFSEMPEWKEWICDDDADDGHRITFNLLESLSISNCGKLSKISHLSLPSLEDLWLSSCPELEMVGFLEGGSLPSMLQRIVIGDCNKLITGRMGWGLHQLSSLSSFFY